MPSAKFDAENLCYLTPATVELLGVQGATRCEWTVTGRPAGAQVVIADPNAPFTTTVEVTQDGTYAFQVCCFYDQAADAGVDPSLGVTPEDRLFCPETVIAGDTVEIDAFGCEDATIEWEIQGGPGTSIVGTENGATATTDPLGSGLVAINAICTRIDANGNEIQTVLNCSFSVLDSSIPRICNTSAAVEIDFVNCGELCECFEFTMVFDCAQGRSCVEDTFGFVVKECPPTPDPAEDCPPLVRVEFNGASPISLTCRDLLECCDTSLCCEPHAPMFMINDLCKCRGWTFEAPAVPGSHYYNACSCNVGQRWCFDDIATVVGSGPAEFVDVMVIWGHNLQNGTVTTSLNTVDQDFTTSIGTINDNSCLEGYSQALVINFPGAPDEGITDFEFTIDSGGQGVVCIDQILIGQKFFLEDDMLPASFVNPHDGDDYELEIKESDCGILSRSVKHTPCDFELEICASEEWMCEDFREFLRYARRHGFMFSWSRNRKPTDVINAWLPKKIRGSTDNFDGTVTVNLQARGFITPPQFPAFLP